MENFLKKYLTNEEMTALKAKYAEANPGSTGLPVYVSKARLDEVLGEKKKAEKGLTDKEAEIAKLQEEHEITLKGLETKLQGEFNTKLKTEIEAKEKDFEVTEAIYGMKGRNVKAIKALIDPSKDPKEELTRIQKEEAYLFEGDLPSGTGKNGSTNPADAEMEIMRRAVGL